MPFGRSANTSYNTPNTSVFPSSPYTLGGEEGEEAAVSPLAAWVTVWGFPPSAASYILQQVGGVRDRTTLFKL